jgi:hypothetical protein
MPQKEAQIAARFLKAMYKKMDEMKYILRQAVDAFGIAGWGKEVLHGFISCSILLLLCCTLDVIVFVVHY